METLGKHPKATFKMFNDDNHNDTKNLSIHSNNATPRPHPRRGSNQKLVPKKHSTLQKATHNLTPNSNDLHTYKVVKEPGKAQDDSDDASMVGCSGMSSQCSGQGISSPWFLNYLYHTTDYHTEYHHSCLEDSRTNAGFTNQSDSR